MSAAEEAILLAAAWSRPDPSRSPELAREFERLFVGPGPVPCPPYESYWRDDGPFLLRRVLMGPCTVDLIEQYARLGLQVSVASADLPDHVAVELEALAVAAREGREEIAGTLMVEHLACWLPAFCDAVAAETEQEYYRTLAADTEDWLVLRLVAATQG